MHSKKLVSKQQIRNERMLLRGKKVLLKSWLLCRTSTDGAAMVVLHLLELIAVADVSE